MTLTAEDLLLLRLHDEKGTVASSVHVRTVLGGALLIELAPEERVEVVDPPSGWRAARVHVSGTPPDDDVLAHALEVVADEQRAPQDLVDRLGRDVREQLVERLAARGLVRREESRVLGLWSRTRWPAADTAREEQVRRELTEVLVHDREPAPRTAALVALLAADDQAHRVVDLGGRSTRQVKARAKEVSEGTWGATAVRDAVCASLAATAAVTAAGASTAATS